MYLFHLSIVKEFYKIVSIIIESRAHISKLRKEVKVAIGVPEFCIGMPYYEDPNIINEMTDQEYAINMKQAKFEVEVELHNETIESRPDISQTSSKKPSQLEPEMNKIKLFECPSDSSESNDSYTIDLKAAKQYSFKITKGTPIIPSLDDVDYFQRDRKISENIFTQDYKMKTLNPNEPIDEESSDDDKFGLDYLEEYQSKNVHKKSLVDDRTAFTTENGMIASPVSRPSFQKRVSVKQVTRKKSFNSSKMIRVRSFTQDDFANN